MRIARRWTVAALALAAALTASTASAATPQNTSNPSIEGNPAVGRVVTANPGSWSGATRFAYTWQRCDQAGASCANISGANGQRYRVDAADAGHRLIVLVTGINSEGRATVNSHPSALVATTGTAQNTGRPTISGTAKVGEELRAERGAWSSATSSFSYQWQRCDANGNACQTVGDATGRTYGVRSADAGRTLRVAVTGYGSSGGSTVVSDRTAVVQGLAAPAPVVNTNPCSKLAASAASQAVAVNDLSLPNRLLISNVEFNPTVLRSRSTFTARFRVMDSCGRPVVGALVYATGVPFGKLQNAPEVATDAQGWATVQLTPTTRLPLAAHTALQLFVRARKSGENVLGGVSTRRLVQVGVGR
jgi:hypothetical protein